MNSCYYDNNVNNKYQQGNMNITDDRYPKEKQYQTNLIR